MENQRFLDSVGRGLVPEQRIKLRPCACIYEKSNAIECHLR